MSLLPIFLISLGLVRIFEIYPVYKFSSIFFVDLEIKGCKGQNKTRVVSKKLFFIFLNSNSFLSSSLGF